ncbi:MAG TPA: NUDIX hydrolase [Candidatus Hydrogenedens sp.]|nr:NUDIX hydrolase [Candidatus Hydrogenedens sp.]HOL19075.1 NUDIX hydrolase [Candidatus Hydrogenedens sp.]HPP58107.1 NUDIX hydrolase [Candidatus Hydrogenedens sp.]
MERWNESSLIYQGKIVNVRVGTVTIDDGQTAFREVIEHPGGVCIAVLDIDHVILVRQFRIAIGTYILEAPAGKIERNEDPMERAKRELEEETGYQAGVFEYLGSAYSSVGYCSERIYFYFATDLKFIGTCPDHDERIEVVQIPLQEVRERLANFGFDDGKTYIALQAMLYRIDKH